MDERKNGKSGTRSSLAYAGKAKLMMKQINKTDKLDGQGLALLLRNGTLPAVSITSGALRDQRALPLQTCRSVKVQLEVWDRVEEQRHKITKERPAIKLVRTFPGVGLILAMEIVMEIGEVERFAVASPLTIYANIVPRVQSSGGRTFYGKVHSNVNRYWKWAFGEAASVIVLHQHHLADRQVIQLYWRIKKRKDHAKAVVAVARPLAAATYWVFKKQEPYPKPAGSKIVSSTQK